MIKKYEKLDIVVAMCVCVPQLKELKHFLLCRSLHASINKRLVLCSLSIILPIKSRSIFISNDYSRKSKTAKKKIMMTLVSFNAI